MEIFSKKVSQIVSILIIHKIIEYKLNSRQIVEYKFNTKNALDLLKYPRYIFY